MDMAEQNLELQAKLQELEHELEVGLPQKPFEQRVFKQCRMLIHAVMSEAARIEGYIGGGLIQALVLIITLCRKATSLRRGMFRHNELLNRTIKFTFIRQLAPITQISGDGH